MDNCRFRAIIRSLFNSGIAYNARFRIAVRASERIESNANPLGAQHMILRNATVGQLLVDSAHRTPDKPALCYGERCVTYGELDRITDEYALDDGRLAFIANASSDRKAPEVVDIIIKYLAAMKRGKIAVFGDRLDYDLSNTDLTDAESILFTSGVTGKPKAVLATHYARVNSAAAHVEALGATADDNFIVAIPLHHCFSLTANLVSAITVGATLCIPDDRHSKSLLECIERDRCTIFNAVPTIFYALIRGDLLNSYDYSTLRTGFIGGASYTPEFFREVNDGLQFNLIPGLGQTEGTAAYTFLPWTASLTDRSETLGRFMEHIQVKLTDRGEICIKGFVVCNALGEPTPLDGWLHTGDLGQIGSDGLLRFKGRLKEIIIRGGENIMPIEIEEAIRAAFPNIGELAVTGTPDERFGEEILVVIATNTIDAQSSPEAPILDFTTPESIRDAETTIRDALALRLPKHKVPRYIRFVDELPKTAAGKIALSALNP